MDDQERDAIRAHFDAASSLLTKHFGGTPTIGVTFPYGLGHEPIYRRLPSQVPVAIEVVAVQTLTGTHRYVAINPQGVTWLVAEHSIVELHGWSPTAADPLRAAYARITLEPNGSAGTADVERAAEAVLKILDQHHLAAIPLLDGLRGMALWIPFDDAPEYHALATWLRTFTDAAAGAHRDFLTTEWYKADRGDRVFLGTQSNHPAMGTILPYSLRGSSALEVAIPIARDKLGTCVNGDVTAANFAQYFAAAGDVFERLRSAITPQRFAEIGPLTVAVERRTYDIPLELMPEDLHSATVAAALAILRDGKTRDASVILAEAIKRGLLPTSVTKKILYLSLHGYIVRTLGVGGIPEIAQIPKTTQFRINRPADDWPDVPLPPRPSSIDPAERAAIVERLRATATGDDSGAFEAAACDAFALLGFVVTHLGGYAQTDGLLVAPLGSEGYRVVLECKTAAPHGVVSKPQPEEAAKFRGEHHAGYSILLGPAFGHEESLDDELQQHAVSLWMVDDLVTAVEAEISTDECRSLLAPGRVMHALEGVLWEREHGHPKRVAVIADLITRLGWQMQVALARGGVLAADTPPLTEEALALMVDALVRAGATGGASRADAEEALRGLQVRGVLRASQAGYVVTVAPRGESKREVSQSAATDGLA
jgi:DNA primase